jgi:hypothetical protein
MVKNIIHDLALALRSLEAKAKDNVDPLPVDVLIREYTLISQIEGCTLGDILDSYNIILNGYNQRHILLMKLVLEPYFNGRD